LTMEGRFDWGRYDFGTFRRRDVLTMGRFDCKAVQHIPLWNNPEYEFLFVQLRSAAVEKIIIIIIHCTHSRQSRL